MTEALKNQDFIAYIDLVSHLRSLSILAFDQKDIEHLESIDRIILSYKKSVEASFKNKLNNSSLYNIENMNYAHYRGGELKTFIEYRFSGVVERVCIAALRKTVLREQIPEAQTGIFYDASRDIELTKEIIKGVLGENDISPGEVI